jgi:hypothetical protein
MKTHGAAAAKKPSPTVAATHRTSYARVDMNKTRLQLMTRRITANLRTTTHFTGWRIDQAFSGHAPRAVDLSRSRRERITPRSIL